uniref:Venom protein n=1 Tax=Scolopendra viridis TaxID=118503 RepID=A0A4D5R9Q3_SCOVI
MIPYKYFFCTVYLLFANLAEMGDGGLTIQQGHPEDFHQHLLKTANTALLLGRFHGTDFPSEDIEDLKTTYDLYCIQKSLKANNNLHQTEIDNFCVNYGRKFLIP